MPNKVIVYSTPTCPYCHLVKSYLKEKKITFVEYDVAADQTRASEIMEITGQMSVPVLLINDKIVVGFQKEKIDQLLQI